MSEGLTVEKPTLSDNFEHMYRDEEGLDSAQIKSLIHILDHKRSVILRNNTFINNNGLKGIINIEKSNSEEGQGSVVIKKNYFRANSGIIGSSVVEIRHKVQED